MPRKIGLSQAKPVIKVAVGIIKKANQVLVAERPVGKPYSGYWEFPGGKIEREESGEIAIKRELHEELGIEVLAAQFWFAHSHEYPDKTVWLEMWLIDQFIGEPEGREAQNLRWVSLDEMQELRLLEGNWFILEKMKALF